MERYRVRGGLVPFKSNYTTYDGDCAHPGALVQANNVTTGWNGTVETMSDIVTPGFKRKSAQGEVIISAMQSNLTQQNCGGSNHILRSIAESCVTTHTHSVEDASAGAFIYSSQGIGTLLIPPSLISSSDIWSGVLVAATQAWQNANAHQADILTDLAEARQTVQMLRNPTSSLQGLTKAITNSLGKKIGGGKVKILKAVAKTPVDMWLQYRYGVRPLVSSVNGVLDALATSKVKERHTYRGSYSLNAQSASSGTISWNAGNHSWIQSNTDNVSIRGGLLFQEEVIRKSTALGLTAGGMLAVPWEIVPFSFVADWFVNVGSFLQGFATSYYKFPLGSWYTVRRERTATWKVTGTTLPTPTGYTLQKPATEERFGRVVDKYRAYPLPGPSLTLKPQSFDKVLADLRIVDSFALAAQQFARIFRG